MNIDINTIKTGDLVAISGDWLLAKTIKLVTKSKWNHIGMFIWIWGELFVLEAEKEGVILTKWDEKKYSSGNPRDRKLLHLTPKTSLNEKDVAMFVLPMVGRKGYDYASLAIYQLIYNITGKWYGKKDIKAKNRFYCSELCAYIHNHFLDYFDKTWWQTAPKSVVREDYYIMTPINY